MGAWRTFYDLSVDCVGSASEGGLVYADWWGILENFFLTQWFFRKKSSIIHLLQIEKNACEVLEIGIGGE